MNATATGPRAARSDSVHPADTVDPVNHPDTVDPADPVNRVNPVDPVDLARPVDFAGPGALADLADSADPADANINAAHRRGARLIYVMGASGSGKDTLLRHLRAALQPHEPILVAHRYITRASGTHEASVSLSPTEFDRRVTMGCFALHWQSHGLRYGIGVEIDTWLASGAAVIVNGSRAHLPEACAHYPALTAVEVVADPEILAQRLAQRGRENPAQIAARLQRATRAFDTPRACPVTPLSNNGAPEDAARQLLAVVRNRLHT